MLHRGAAQLPLSSALAVGGSGRGSGDELVHLTFPLWETLYPPRQVGQQEWAMLETQILRAMQTAVADGRWEVADHLLRALEALETAGGCDDAVGKAFQVLGDPLRLH